MTEVTRFQLGFQTPEADLQPGDIFRRKDGTDWLVNPDGSFAQLGTGAGAVLMIGCSLSTSSANLPVPRDTVPLAFTYVPGRPWDYSITQTCATLIDALAGGQHIANGFAIYGTADLPSVPEEVAAYVAGQGADPSDAWDLSYTQLTIACLTGTDAGKTATVNFDLETPHPLSLILNPGADFHANDIADWQQSGGDLTLVRARTGYSVANAGLYAATMALSVDFLYP